MPPAPDLTSARGRFRAARAVCLTVAVWLTAAASAALARDVSAPAILQYFESRYTTIEDRAPDLFKAGYGAVYTPPPGRADQGNWSVGYDVYDRFDLGKPGNPTLYGTEAGLVQTVGEVHKFGDYYVDYIINHNGFSDAGTAGFLDAGGYPGMVLQWPGTSDGDFHSAFAVGDKDGRVAGLVDIDHGTNIQLVRNPVPACANNIPAGTAPAYGRLANVPDEANRRFYPDHNLQPIRVYDPATGEGDIPIYPFNTADPTAGDPATENVTGYLMRNAQWLVQTVGVDGFRIDAAKHVEGFALDYFDRAVYRSSGRDHLDGSQRHVFSFAEVYDGNKGYLQTFVKKTIDPGEPGVVGGNRDTLDFPLHFALRDNLTGNGYVNNWYNVRDATLDTHDDGIHNGSQGVMFVQSHDDWGPELSNVGYAYVLLHPGNAVVYFNAREFGTGRDFPKDGRGDALGGAYGDAITRLVCLRNRYGEGNYHERWIEKELFAFEREGSCVTLLSNRTDAGYDSRTLHTTFAPGTPLIELTGNASNPAVDPRDDIPPLLVVNGDGTVNVRFLRNASYDQNMNAFYHRNGYLVYGLASPEGTLTLEGVSATLPGSVPAMDGTADENAYANATTRLSDIQVVTGNSFEVRLQTVPVNLLGFHRDVWADGDNALLRVDAGLDLNGNGHVDYTDPGNRAAYGFEEFVGKKSPLILSLGLGHPGGDGEFRQAVDAGALAEGMHYLTVRAFRHRTDGGPAIWQDWKEALYVDRLPPVCGIDSFDPPVAGAGENRDLYVRSLDLTAEAVHVLLDVGAALSDGEILAMVTGANRAETMDRDLFKRYFAGLTTGNHAVTVVAQETTGTVGIQRFGGLATDTIFGRGLGDLDFSGWFSTADITLLETLYWDANRSFNPAGDTDGDGWITDADVYGLEGYLTAGGADPATMQAYHDFAATVPDPATLGLVAAGVVGMALRRRRAARCPGPRSIARTAGWS